MCVCQCAWQTFFLPAVAGKDLTYRCQAFRQTSSVAELAPHFHEYIADDRLSVQQAGSPPKIAEFWADSRDPNNHSHVIVIFNVTNNLYDNSAKTQPMTKGPYGKCE